MWTSNFEPYSERLLCLFPIGTHAVLAGCVEFLESRIYIKNSRGRDESDGNAGTFIIIDRLFGLHGIHIEW